MASIKSILGSTLVSGLSATAPNNFLPSNLPNLQLWMDANDTSTFDLDAEYARLPTVWRDKSTNARVFNAISVTSTNLLVRKTRPLGGWKSDKTVLCVHTGASRGFKASATLLRESLYDANGKDCTIYMILNPSDMYYTFGTVFHVSSVDYFRFSNTSGNYRWISSSEGVAGVNTPLYGNIQIITLRRSVNTAQLYLNGKEIDTGTPTNAVTAGVVTPYLFASSDSGGSGVNSHFGELIWYNTAHDTATRQQVEDYLAQKFLEGF